MLDQNSFNLFEKRYQVLLSDEVIKKVEQSLSEIDTKFGQISFYDMNVIASSAENLAKVDQSQKEKGDDSKEEQKEEVKQVQAKTLSFAEMRQKKAAAGKKPQ